MCVSLQTSEVTGIPFAFWLSYGSAIAGNFIRNFFKTTSELPKNPLERERGRERGYIWLILCLLKKKNL